MSSVHSAPRGRLRPPRPRTRLAAVASRVWLAEARDVAAFPRHCRCPTRSPVSLAGVAA